MRKKTSIVCYGEVLWDVFPNHKVAGGAPLNVAFHASNLGMEPHLISSLGADEQGEQLRSFLKLNEISDDLIHTNFTFPTGTVQVKLDEEGSASYEIVKPVAWDFLYAGKAAAEAVPVANFLLFGSLVCRSENNYNTLLELLDKAQKSVFDVNLRPPFYQRPIIQSLLEVADIVKMNDDELAEIVGWYSIEGDIAKQMEFIRKQFSITTLVVTAGKHGAYCLHEQQLFIQEGFPVKVNDTVGSGDSFLAAFLFKLANQAPWQECLAFACATGALVATRTGGTPVIKENDITAFMKNHSRFRIKG